MIGWLFDTSLAVAALMLLVLAVRGTVAHLFGAGWAYALWLLPALRIVLPPLHLLGNSFPSLLAAPAEAPIEAALVSAPAGTQSAFQWEPLLLASWLAGAAAVVLWQGWAYLAFTRRLGIGSQVQASFGQEIGIIESAQVDGPLAIGLLDRWIVVPADFTTRYSPQEQRLALLHERIHHEREDIFWNMVALAVLALNWFNPIAYVAFRAFRTDQELSCDATVAARASACERHDYARALVKSASRPGLIAACPLNHAGQLKRRLRMMKDHRRSPIRALGGAGALGALLLIGISVTETASVAATDIAPVAVSAVQPAAPASAQPPIAARTQAEAPRAEPQRDPSREAAPRAARPVEAPVPAAKASAAAEPAVPALPAPAAELASPSAVRRIVMLRLEGRDRLAMLAPYALAGRELQMVQAHVRRMRAADPAIKTELEKLLAARTERTEHVHHITLKDE